VRITDYRLYEVRPRWLFLKIGTSDGTVGWGEHVDAGGSGTVARAVRTLLDEHLLGEDPLRIEDHWQAMYRGGFYRGGPVLMAAIAGIDQALWDIKGKHYGAPVHDLLGGAVRDRMRVYTWIGGDRPSDIGEHAAARREEGFTAVKMNATPELQRIDSPSKVQAAADRAAEARAALGEDADFALDFHGRVSKPMAKRLFEAVAPYDPMFVEEPVLPEHNDALPEIARHAATPIATGERMFSRFEFKELFEQGVVDVVQPDLSHAGGITEVTKIASMAEAHDVALAPHCPLGPIALAACLQVDAACHNALIQESSLGIHYNRQVDLLEYLVDPGTFAVEDGYVEVLTDPGLGIEIDESALRLQEEDSGADDAREDRAADDAGENGAVDDAEDGGSSVWRHPDGSVAEW